MSAIPTVTRDYNSWTIDGFRGTITKTSDTSRLVNELKFYLDLPNQFQIYFPRLVRHEMFMASYSEGASIELEYYPYKNLGEYSTGKYRLKPNEWRAVIQRLYDIIQEWKLYSSENVKGDVVGLPTAMYAIKTYSEYEIFKKDGSKYDLFASDTIRYQNKTYRNFETIWNDGDTGPFLHDLAGRTEYSFMHGDFCFGNILYGGFADHENPILKFIDPRGSFGYRDHILHGNIGDARYDVAKLSHSIYGQYEMLNADQFYLTQDGDSIKCLGYRNQNKIIQQMFDQIFFENGEFNKKEIRFIEGLIFVGACARHYENPDRQAALYLRGIKALNEAMDVEE